MILIKNKTKLSIEECGKLIDDYMNSSIGDTMYYGKIDRLQVFYKNRFINIECTILKRYVRYIFWYESEGKN